jgi:hypothetical protein
VLARIICALVRATSSGCNVLTVAYVPTGINAGVSIEPRDVFNRPSRAFDVPSQSNTSNESPATPGPIEVNLGSDTRLARNVATVEK